MKSICFITTLIAVFAFHPQPAFAQLLTLEKAKLEKAKLDKAAANDAAKRGIILEAGDRSGYVVMPLAGVKFSRTLKTMIDDLGQEDALKNPIPTAQSKGLALAAIGSMLTVLATDSKPATFIQNELAKKPSKQVQDILVLANYLDIAPVLNIAINVYGDKVFVSDLEGPDWSDIENDLIHYAAYKKETFGLVPAEIQQRVISARLRSIDRVFVNNTKNRRQDAIKHLDLAAAQIVAYLSKNTDIGSEKMLPLPLLNELKAQDLIGYIHFGPWPTEFATWPSHCPLKSNKDYDMYSDGTPDDRYVDNGDRTVTDICTKLIWEQVPPTTGAPLQESKERCAKLNDKNVKGWRMPTRIELQSIVNYEAVEPALNRLFKEGDAEYWSSTLIRFLDGAAFTFRFDGRFDAAKITENKRVRCVRGEHGGPQSAGAMKHYSIEKSTVIDNFTGAQWQRQVLNIGKTQNEALGYCKSLVLDGTGWSLPTVKQLATLIDTLGHYGIDETAFPNTPGERTWSRTGGIREAWVVVFTYGLDRFLSVNDAYRARCVR